VQAGRKPEGGVDGEEGFTPFGIQPPAVHFCPAIEPAVGPDAPGGQGVLGVFGGDSGPEIVGKEEGG